MADIKIEIIYWKNDMLLMLGDDENDVPGLKDEITGVFINDATVQATVKFHNTGVEVGGQSWPLTMDYVTLSEGNYRGILDAALDVEDGDKLLVEVTVTASGGRDAHFVKHARVLERD